MFLISAVLPVRPPRPPPPTRTSHSMVTLQHAEGENNWKCSACTFSNHPALDKCEICEMPLMTSQRSAPAGFV